MTNLLSQSSSPYLLQRKDDPVDWRPWGREAFDEAQRSGKPVLLSIGFSACHRCQAMGRESFLDPITAALMNDLFVNILVDRDERPDIDTIYQAAVQVFDSQGGWPLTMFLTSNGDAYGGGSYFPPEPQAGLPAFSSVLIEVSRLAAEARDRVAGNVAAVRDRLQHLFAEAHPGNSPNAATVDLAARQVCQQFDIFYGGLPGASKIPNAPAVELLWRAYCNNPLRQYSRAAELTLTGLCQGGIYDHVGGGFARKAVDEFWFAPRFEKRLNENAQLVELLSLVAAGSANPLYRRRVEETVSWALREMTTANGAFASSVGAESNNQEGAYYVWTADEISQVLGGDAALFMQVYDVRPEGNWNGRNILHRLASSAPFDGPTEERLRSACARLRLHRLTREAPARDDKILADWNGLMISALAAASALLDRPEWQAAAVKAFWAVVDNMEADGRISHCGVGAASIPGFATDYANMARAALALFEATGHGAYLSHARNWVGTLNTHFWLNDIGGYTLTADDAENPLLRVRSISDWDSVSANGAMIAVLGRLFYLTRDAVYAEYSRLLLDAFFVDASKAPATAASYFNGLDLILGGTQVVIIGSRNDPAVSTLRGVVGRASLPNRMLTIIAPGEMLPSDHPAFGKGQIGKGATVYVCRARACSEAITDPAVLELRLKTREPKGVQ